MFVTTYIYIYISNCCWCWKASMPFSAFSSDLFIHPLVEKIRCSCFLYSVVPFNLDSYESWCVIKLWLLSFLLSTMYIVYCFQKFLISGSRTMILLWCNDCFFILSLFFSVLSQSKWPGSSVQKEAFQLFSNFFNWSVFK